VAYTAYGYLGHLSKIVCPVNLILPYPRPIQTPAGAILPGAVLIAFGSGWALALMQRCPYVTVGWFWFMGCLLPVCGLFRLGPQALADRYTYFPSIGLFIALTWGIAEIARRWRWRWRPPTIGILAGVALTACVLATNRQLSYWHDSERLYRHALQVNRENCAAHNGLGFELFQQGKVDEAIVCFSEALRLNPDYGEAHGNLGIALMRQGKLSEGAAHLSAALRLNPNNPEAHYNLGLALLELNHPRDAADQFAEALRLNPDAAGPHYHLAIALIRQEKTKEALAHAEKARDLALAAGQTALAAKADELLKQHP